jgi:phosphonate degradation associated HDIG domain protein
VTLVDLVVDIFERRGAESYLGENVTMSEHMLQAAALAEADGGDEALVIGALLHDIGHYADEFSAYSPTDVIDKRHEISGAAILEGLIDPRVVGAVRLHVAAKRYLCAVEPDYFSRLSAASVHTLELQGGPMTPDEVAEFESRNGALDAVRIRRWDEQAKVVGAQTPPLGHFLPSLRRVML